MSDGGKKLEPSTLLAGRCRIAIVFTLVPRREAPLAGTKPSAPVCTFARIRTWSNGLVDLQIAASAQGMILAASTMPPTPTLRYATIGDVDEPFDDWAPNLYAQTIATTERIFPCAASGRQLMGGGARERRGAHDELWTTVARFPHPSGTGLFGPGGRMDSANIDLTDLDCAAVDDLTIFAGLGPYRGSSTPTSSSMSRTARGRKCTRRRSTFRPGSGATPRARGSGAS